MTSTYVSGASSDALAKSLCANRAVKCETIVQPTSRFGLMWPQLCSRQVIPLKQWTMEQHNFNECVTKGYASMRNSEVCLIVAGSDIGKTTWLPYSIANTHAVRGLILLEDQRAVDEAHRYMTVECRIDAVDFVKLRTPVSQKFTASVATVFYAVASTFFDMLHKDALLCDTLEIGFVFFVEPHNSQMEVSFSQHILTLSALKNLKAIFILATTIESLDANGKVVTVDIGAANSSATLMNSVRNVPMHCSQLFGKTLLCCINAARSVTNNDSDGVLSTFSEVISDELQRVKSVLYAISELTTGGYIQSTTTLWREVDDNQPLCCNTGLTEVCDDVSGILEKLEGRHRSTSARDRNSSQVFIGCESDSSDSSFYRDGYCYLSLFVVDVHADIVSKFGPTIKISTLRFLLRTYPVDWINLDNLSITCDDKQDTTTWHVGKRSHHNFLSVADFVAACISEKADNTSLLRLGVQLSHVIGARKSKNLSELSNSLVVHRSWTSDRVRDEIRTLKSLIDLLTMTGYRVVCTTAVYRCVQCVAAPFEERYLPVVLNALSQISAAVETSTRLMISMREAGSSPVYVASTGVCGLHTLQEAHVSGDDSSSSNYLSEDDSPDLSDQE